MYFDCNKSLLTILDFFNSLCSCSSRKFIYLSVLKCKQSTISNELKMNGQFDMQAGSISFRPVVVIILVIF